MDFKVIRLKGARNIYEEIAAQYGDYIRLGAFSEGKKLPSCRELAIELGINPNTVERAYSVLESEGLIITIPKKGVYVAANNKLKADLTGEAETRISHLRAAGLTYKELLKIAGRVYGAAQGKSE